MTKRPLRRKILISFLLVLCLAAGGCRLFRFLEMKSQLDAFGENFAVSDHDRLRLVFENPVLLEEDVEWLMVYSPPEKAYVDDSSQLWTYHLVKQYPGKKNEDGNFDLLMGMKITRGKLSEFVFPERLAKYVNKEVLGKVMRSVGAAEVKKLEKSSTAEVRSLEEKEIPSRSEVLEILGLPYSQDEEARFVYRYRLREKTPKGKFINFSLVLSFDAETAKLSRLVLPLRSVRLAMNFGPGVTPK